MSGGPFPFIMALLGIIDALLGLVFFFLKLGFWILLAFIVIALANWGITELFGFAQPPPASMTF